MELANRVEPRYIAVMGVPSAWDGLEMDDLPNDELRLIAQDLGLDAAVKVWKRLAGTTMSLPSRFPKEYSMRYIHAHYDGRNTSQLARSLGITTRTVQTYLATKMPAPRPSNLQTAMPL